MPTIADAISQLEEIAPPELAEDWDNVGLLVGDPTSPLSKAMTCLTLTADVAEEAIGLGAQLVVTHHPLPFRGLKTLTTETQDGGVLWRLIGAGVAVYSAHTAYDSAAGGINQQWAERLGLADTGPLEPAADRTDGAGVGRIGRWTDEGGFGGLLAAIKRVANQAEPNQAELRAVQPADIDTPRVAIACGSGGSLLDSAFAAGCEVFLTGEMTFHDCLRCRARGVGVVLTGHYASERFAVETLAKRLSKTLPGVSATVSQRETDPLCPV